MFQPKFNASKLKVCLKLAINRVKMLQKKKENQRTLNRKEIAQTIEKEKLELAAIRTEQIIRDDNLIETLELMELYFNTLVSRMGTIEQMKSCDPSIRDAVCTVIWATPHLQAEIPEMKQIQQFLTIRYGKDFVKDAMENNGNCVSDRVIKKLSCAQPGEQLVQASMALIASTYNVNYTPPPAPVPEEFLKGDFDPLMFPNAPSGANSFGGGGGGSHLLPGAPQPHGGLPKGGSYNGWDGPGGGAGGPGPASIGGGSNDLHDVFPPVGGGGGGPRPTSFGGGPGPASFGGGPRGGGMFPDGGSGMPPNNFGATSGGGSDKYDAGLYPPQQPRANGPSDAPQLYPPSEPASDRPRSPGGSTHLDSASLKALEARGMGDLPGYQQSVETDRGAADVDQFDPFPMPPTSGGGTFSDDMPAIPGQESTPSVGGQSAPGANSGADFDDLMKRFHDMKTGEK
eukprot:m.198923 g.198923  ORF g.198923 m.198923 type:complete len:456 (+) comp18767_c0_seq2:277-1644(+)